MLFAGILSALSCSSLDQLTELLGPSGSAALSDLQQLWRLAEGYGYADWLVFDASVVRGLAYYTGNKGLGGAGEVLADFRAATKCDVAIRMKHLLACRVWLHCNKLLSKLHV